MAKKQVEKISNPIKDKIIASLKALIKEIDTGDYDDSVLESIWRFVNKLEIRFKTFIEP